MIVCYLHSTPCYRRLTYLTVEPKIIFEIATKMKSTVIYDNLFESDCEHVVNYFYLVYPKLSVYQNWTTRYLSPSCR